MIDDIDFLRTLIQHDPETGKLFWKYRDRSFYDTKSAWLRFNRHFVGKQVDAECSVQGYMKFTLRHKCSEKSLRSHRVLWALVHGEWPGGLIDHINGDRCDNRICNLRVVDPIQNSRNMSRPSHNTSGVIGVNFCNTRRRWVAKGFLRGHRKHLGYYDNFEEASNARKAWETANAYDPNHGRDNPRRVRGVNR